MEIDTMKIFDLEGVKMLAFDAGYKEYKDYLLVDKNGNLVFFSWALNPFDTEVHFVDKWAAKRFYDHAPNKCVSEDEVLCYF
jgi:hypothetical protein